MREIITRRVIGFCHRVTYAALIAGATWLFSWLPSAVGRSRFLTRISHR